MAASRQPGPLGQRHDGGRLPPRTPGPLGNNDAADPSSPACCGDTPGPLGLHDGADPAALGSEAKNSSNAGGRRVTSPIWIHTAGRKTWILRTYSIPEPHSTDPPLLADSDIARAATDLGVEPATIYAIAKVESGGRSGFDEEGRPKILFEAHKFSEFTGGGYDNSHPHLSQAKWTDAYYGDDQWTRLTEAFTLDAESALKAASWGKFQVMGFNHNGFDDVFQFCDAMFVSEAEHLRTFLAFCKDNHLIQYLKTKEWAKFAQGYNGAEYKANKYDEKLENAYNEYKKRSE
jgi:hypothetical protein